MAIRSLGARSGRTSQEGTRGLHTLAYRRRQVYKVVEARPISAIKPEQAVLFFLDIVHRFGVPNSIITEVL